MKHLPKIHQWYALEPVIHIHAGISRHSWVTRPDNTHALIGQYLSGKLFMQILANHSSCICGAWNVSENNKIRFAIMALQPPKQKMTMGEFWISAENVTFQIYHPWSWLINLFVCRSFVLFTDGSQEIGFIKCLRSLPAVSEKLRNSETLSCFNIEKSRFNVIMF